MITVWGGVLSPFFVFVHSLAPTLSSFSCWRNVWWFRWLHTESFLHCTPTVSSLRSSAIMYHPNFIFIKTSLRFFWLFDRFTKHHVIGLMYSILDRDFFCLLDIILNFRFKRYILYCCLDRNTSYFAKKYFDNYNFNAILGRHFWSNAGEICQDILIFFSSVWLA